MSKRVIAFFILSSVGLATASFGFGLKAGNSTGFVTGCMAATQDLVGALFGGKVDPAKLKGACEVLREQTK